MVIKFGIVYIFFFLNIKSLVQFKQKVTFCNPRVKILDNWFGEILSYYPYLYCYTMSSIDFSDNKAVLWGANEPNEKYECVYIRKQQGQNDLLWLTSSCNMRMRYICHFGKYIYLGESVTSIY